jgi:sec-independent protein translocase protein TatA
MPNLRGWEIIVLLAIVLLLFGSKKLPDAARGIGRSLRIFKAETKGLMDDDKNADETPAVAAAPQTPAVPPANPVDATILPTGPVADPVEEQRPPSAGRASA